MPTAPRTRQNGPRFRRPSHQLKTAERGYDQRWKEFRLSFIRKQAIESDFRCRMCNISLGTLQMSDIHVDHIVRHEGQDDPRFWDEGNLQLLCASCHGRKTQRETGGFKGRVSTNASVPITMNRSRST